MRIIKSNRAMAKLLAGADAHAPVDLDPQLAGYVAHGLAIEPDGTIVAIAAADVASVASERSQFQDRVGYESVVNKVRLTDWASAELKRQPLALRVAHAIRLADVVGEVALVHGTAITVIISVDVDDVVFRFHGHHDDEVPWLSDPDGYAEPIMLRSYAPSA